MDSDPRDFLASFKDVLDEMYETCKRKNADYAGDRDPFYNFSLCESFKITDTKRGMLVRMSDKFARICNLLDTEAQVKDEAVTDTLQDLAVYSILLMLYIQREARNDTDGQDLPRSDVFIPATVNKILASKVA